MSILNRDERNLIFVQGLYYLGDALAGIFVVVFIFSNSDVATALLYTGINFVGLLIWYVLSGRIMEKLSSGTLVRIGLALNALLYLCLFLLRDNAVHYILPLGLLDGTAAGLFWAGLNLNQYVYSQHHTRVEYFGLQSAINNAMQAAGPVVGGALITVLGRSTIMGISSAYAMLFLITSVVYFCGAVFINKLPQHELLTFSYKKFFTHTRTDAWKRVLWQHAVVGCFDVLLGTVVILLIWNVVHGELLLGVARTSLAVVMAIGGLLAVTMLKKKYAFWIGPVGEALGILGFAFVPDMRGVWFFVLLFGGTGAFVTTWLLTQWFHTLDREKLDWQHDFHVLIERDIALGIPRIVGYFVLAYFVARGDQVAVAWRALYILPIFPILLGVLFSVHAKKETEILPD